jgi:hypothetical protein
MAQLHLVFFADCQRDYLRHPLGGRPSADLGLLDFVLVKLQLHLAALSSGLQKFLI